jgi:hypothetical protein
MWPRKLQLSKPSNISTFHHELFKNAKSDLGTPTQELTSQQVLITIAEPLNKCKK